MDWPGRSPLGNMGYSPPYQLSRPASFPQLASFARPSSHTRSTSRSSPAGSRLFLDPVRKTTPPAERNTPPQDEQHAAAKRYTSPYEQALSYVKTYKGWRLSHHVVGSREDYEKPFSCQMSLGDWVKLRRDLNLEETEEAFPKISYDASRSTLIIQCMPSPVHESIISLFSGHFHSAKQALPLATRYGINLTTGQDYNGFEGEYEGSEKRPDLAIEQLDASGEFTVKWVLEAGLTETYEQLVNDMKLWLEGKREVSMAVLIKFEENPKYRCPISRDMDDEDFKLLGIPQREKEIRARDCTLEEEYGPVTYKGFTWVGKISTVFMEVWKRDPNTGLARQHGGRVGLLPPDDPSQVRFRLSDFLLVTPIEDRTITFDWGNFRHLLKVKLRTLAVSRCRAMLRARNRTEEADQDYQP